MLESTLPHETQDQPQDSLQVTPYACEQEAVDSDVTAGRMNWMAEMAKPTEIADIDLEKAALGGKPEERACRVNKGDETMSDVDGMTLLGGGPAQRVGGVDKGNEEREPQMRLLKAEFYCKETNQRNANTSENLPSTYKLPLEGEWTGYASGEASESEGNTNGFNAAIEHADGSDESIETTDTKDIESEGCERVTSRCECVDGVSVRNGSSNELR